MAASDPIRPRRWVLSGIEFDAAEGRLRVDGREVAVKPLSLKLLRVLVAAAPSVMRRDTLLAQVWNRAPDLVSRNVLSNAVARLREELGDQDGKVLQTVPGIGYRLNGPVEPLRDTTTPPAPATMGATNGALVGAPPSASAGMPAPTAPDVEADRFMTRLWLDALRGRGFGHPQMTLIDALRGSIERAESELADAPLVLACIHRTIADHALVQRDTATALHHLRRAITLCPRAKAGPVPDMALEMHFSLCSTLANRVTWTGDPSDLTAARSELALGHAMLRRSPHAGASVHVKAQCAELMLAFYEDDWTRALAASSELLRRADAWPGLEARKHWEYRCHHAVILLRAGHEAEALEAIQALFDGSAPALAPTDIVHLYARSRHGGICVAARRYGDAAAVLEPLQDDLARAGRAATGIARQADVWLGEAWLETGRLGDALSLLGKVHASNVEQSGATAESTLEALLPLTRALVAADRSGDALALLEEGVTPRLRELAMPGQRHAVLALARWIDLLFEQGRLDRATALLDRLRPRDLRQAVIRPDDATAFFERCRRMQRSRSRARTGQRIAVGE